MLYPWLTLAGLVVLRDLPLVFLPGLVDSGGQDSVLILHTSLASNTLAMLLHHGTSFSRRGQPDRFDAIVYPYRCCEQHNLVIRIVMSLVFHSSGT